MAGMAVAVGVPICGIGPELSSTMVLTFRWGLVPLSLCFELADGSCWNVRFSLMQPPRSGACCVDIVIVGAASKVNFWVRSISPVPCLSGWLGKGKIALGCFRIK